MTPPEILREVRAHGGRPRLADGIVITEWIENRRLVAVFRDALERIVELLEKELRNCKQEGR